MLFVLYNMFWNMFTFLKMGGRRNACLYVIVDIEAELACNHFGANFF
jgi:hypothetical protein